MRKQRPRGKKQTDMSKWQKEWPRLKARLSFSLAPSSVIPHTTREAPLWASAGPWGTSFATCHLTPSQVAQPCFLVPWMEKEQGLPPLMLSISYWCRKCEKDRPLKGWSDLHHQLLLSMAVLLISPTSTVQLGEVRHRSLCTQLWSRDQVWRRKGLFSIMGSLFCLLRAGINVTFLGLFFPKVQDFRLLFLGDEVLTTSRRMLCIGCVFYSGYFHFCVLSLNQKDVLFPSKEMGGMNRRGTVRTETELRFWVWF